MFWKSVSIGLISLLSSGAFAAFIQNPIPPSFNKSFFQDTNADGKMDRVVFQFLGGITPEYIEGMIDSIVVTWVDSASKVTRFTLLPSALKIDPSYDRQVYFDFKNPVPTQSFLTSLNEPEYDGYGTALMYQSNGEAIPITMKDNMIPVIQETFFKSYRGRGSDSLSVLFSEPVYENPDCQSILEFKSTSANTVYEWNYSTLNWDASHRKALFVLNEGMGLGEPLSPRDSIRIKPFCLADFSKNQVTKEVAFMPLTGSYPLEIHTVNKATFIKKDLPKNAPIFELQFLPFASEFPNDTAIGVGLDVGGSEFQTVIAEELSLRYPALYGDKKNGVSLAKVLIWMKISVFTSLGTYVASAEEQFNGSDSRLESEGKRVFWRWHFLSDARRCVQTGVYLVDIDIRITYNGKLVYQNKEKGSRMQSWGILRR